MRHAAQHNIARVHSVLYLNLNLHDPGNVPGSAVQFIVMYNITVNTTQELESNGQVHRQVPILHAN